MKLVKGFVIKTVGGKCVAVATADAAMRFKGMIVLNDTAKFIFNQLMIYDTTAEEISKKLADDFNITEEEAYPDVVSFIAKITALNILDNQ